MSKILAFIFIFLSVGTLSAQDSLINQIFSLAYNMDYQQAEHVLAENKSKIEPFYFAFLDIDISYWKNVTGTDKPNYKAFESTLEIYSCETASSFEEKGIQLIYLSYKLRYELKRLKRVRAISTHSKTKGIFEEIKSNTKLKSIENPDFFELYNSSFIYFSNYFKLFI